MAVFHLHETPFLRGESQIFEALGALPDTWHVFYSVEFLDRGRSDRQRELDFLALHPAKGAVFIEVKGGQVRFDQGQAEQLLDGGWKPINPARQLNNVRRVALEFLRPYVDCFIPAKQLYCFPAITRPETGLSQEIDTAGFFGEECLDLADTIEHLFEDESAINDLGILVEPLRSCLRDPESDADSDDVGTFTQLPTLTELRDGKSLNVRTLTELQSVMVTHRAELQSIWDDIINRTTDLEIAEGIDVAAELDLLSSLMSETDKILGSTSIDIGVFGQVKRGKSTLVNALVGTEVSPVGLLPKTAVPVVIEWAPEESGSVFFSDGTRKNLPLLDAVQFATQSARKQQIASSGPVVDRVLIRLPLEWLPPGIRLIDTPGLEDPSLSETYAEYTKAELDRLSAGVFVICYPPGPEAGELKLLSSLGGHGIAKMFFVVNMWSDVWAQPGSREEVSGYIEELLSNTQADSRSYNQIDARVFTANLGLARQCQFNEESTGETGLDQIKTALEIFAREEALVHIASAAALRLLEVSSVISSTLTNRERVISDPRRVKEMKADLEKSRSQSVSALESVCEKAVYRCQQLNAELATIASQPFKNARSEISKTLDRNSLIAIEKRLHLEAATAASKIISKLQQTSSEIVRETRLELTSSLGDSNWNFNQLVKTDSIHEASFLDSSIIPHQEPSDLKAGGRGIGATLGAILGGGGGIALVAAGPIGIALGAVVGFLLGDAFGDVFSNKGNSTAATPSEISALSSRVTDEELRSLQGVNAVIEELQLQLRFSLKEHSEQLLQSSRNEIALLENLLKDESSRRAANVDIREARAALARVTG